MARPRKVSPEGLSEAIDDLIRQYMDTGEVSFLTDFALMEKLGVSSRTLDKYYEGEADREIQDNSSISDTDKERYKKHGYCEAIKRLVEFRRSECVRHIAGAKNGSTITGWIFLSKQPRYGGFQDVQRVEKQSSGSFTVCIAGPDGKPLKE